MSFAVRFRGTPMDASIARGCTPLAAKSLMFMTTALRAACCSVMPGGTSVFPTSMSVFMMASFWFPMSMAETSSPNGTGMLGIWSSWSRMRLIIFRSPNSSAVLNAKALHRMVLCPNVLKICVYSN